MTDFFLGKGSTCNFVNSSGGVDKVESQSNVCRHQVLTAYCWPIQAMLQ